MPELVTAAQLRAVLGVPNTLYDDTALETIIDTAEDAIGDFLIQWKVGIDKPLFRNNNRNNNTHNKTPQIL
jgi:hypothetical protein